jgi:flagellar transcriptional activator FlhD
VVFLSKLAFNENKNVKIPKIWHNGTKANSVLTKNTDGDDMISEELHQEIRDTNLSYLMLAQQMIRQDKPAAICRLGVSQEIADLLGNLSNAQILKLASGSTLLTRLRFDDAAILGMLTHDAKEKSLTKAHTAILMASQALEDIR